MKLAAHTAEPAQNAQPSGSDGGLDEDGEERTRGDATPMVAHSRYTMPRKMRESWKQQPPSIACVSGSIGSVEGSGMNTRTEAAAMAFDRVGRWKSTRSIPDARVSNNEWPIAPTRRVPAMDWFRREVSDEHCMVESVNETTVSVFVGRRRWGWRGRRSVCTMVKYTCA